ncbi:hypothetical protein [Flammeovirga sp. OC4]|uniref:hypothetical protein n=1 Tax=Flammeovirga sp. OC4 TaxID=1382345 RepID=UPI0005C686E0|nr:hypothetical protein [Flammeovirga sp. OC4]
MKKVILLLLVFLSIHSAYAQYTETMNPKGFTKNLVKDFGVKPNKPDLNQSQSVQDAIDALAKSGGGNLVIPKGEYLFGNVYLKSNIHILVESGTVLRPYWPEGTKASLFNFSAKFSAKNPSAYIENVSIRGVKGRFVVDYSNRIRKKGEGCRAIIISMVKNFLVQDMDVKDNFTTYCGMVISPVKQHKKFTIEDTKSWKISRATKGTVRDCRHFNASPGYGLVQIHGADGVHFENLYSLGGVTLRLETGANNPHVGVFNITGKNIYNENGRSALMMGPHSAKNGKVVVDGVVSKSSTYAVNIGQAGVKHDAPDQTPGRFSNDSKVTNIHAIFGKTAQVKNQSIHFVPEEYYNDLKLWPDNKFLTGPSISAVNNHAETYTVTVENVTMEGFKYNNDKKILTAENAPSGDRWKIWAKWKSDFLDDAHRTKNASVVVEYEIPKSTLNIE